MRRRWRWALAGTAALAVLLGTPAVWAYGSSAGRIVDSDDAPDTDVALVLGAGVRPDGRPSQLLAGRLDVAAGLYHEGVVRVLLLSGSVGPGDYDEPGTMREYLVSRGVPTEAIVEDGSGNDTWESCVRTRDVYGVRELIVISQRFHLPRAVALCRSAGLEVHGVPHESGQTNPSGTRFGYLRETGARLPAMITALFKNPEGAIEADPDSSVADALAAGSPAPAPPPAAARLRDPE
ncbi:vancomycin permeability regulator SanA [Actinoalloteichus hoggarensis]|uniref:Vancomycin high temperature exclusion protein n=1 Tax=Actinoalloteichus hoggarensis TaxID=1470176 RepID=A0A221W3N2_9PSEU|nr:ElyC/SanA/YdcF family protein [Actinoalloteichus hoggarensis]ASO20296.1 vancomycin high temperature exclusion protein [Actinoalloteichus hoggarensis]MBB5918990.1 vancomycin permeability regulator SanA [Actinoalloteichus hoggarensis]